MKDTSATCERAGEMLSVLYGEASEREQREFDLHVKDCASCRAEFASFANVREAIGEWRDEALNGFVSSPMVAAPPRVSAVAALRQFFDLSPLWMKAAVGFAALVFCVLIFLAFGRLRTPDVTQVAAKNPTAAFTKEDVNRAVEDALAKQAALAQAERPQQTLKAPEPHIVAAEPRNSTVAKSVREPQARRPFSRAEREQLAAELRLVSSDENELESPDK
jgi:hypothetical protein